METSPSRSSRLVFIDIARCYAVILALLSHTLLAVGFFEVLGPDSVYIKQFTRMATPMFVFMFGFMVELVYVRKWEGNQSAIVSRLFIRSFQCYVAFALTSMCAFLGGLKSLEGFLASLVFLSDSRFGNILRVYSVMLIVTPALIKLRLACGVKSLYLILIAALFLHSSIHELQHLDFHYAGKPMNIFFGIGNVLGGPSVAGAFTFYISGMIVAAGLRSSSPSIGLAGLYKSVAFLLLVLIILGWALIPDQPKEAWIYFADFTYRKHNSPGYFIIGTICSLLVIAFFGFLVGNKKIPKALLYIIPVGTSSLISYTAGNMLLNLSGTYIENINLVLFIFFFFLTVILITRNIHKAPYYSKIQAVMNFEYNKVLQRTDR